MAKIQIVCNKYKLLNWTVLTIASILVSARITVVTCQHGLEEHRNATISTSAKVRDSNEKTNQSEVCECIEYWNCTGRKGQFFSYCGNSDAEVCCYFGNTSAGVQEPKLNLIPLDKHNAQNTRNSNRPTISSTSKTNVNPNNSTIWSPVIDPNAKTQPCGMASILGNLDSVAEFREWPWHVAIMEAKDDLYICGGSMIAQKYILTAAHCVSSYVGKNQRLKIRAGEFDVSTNSESSPHVEVLVRTVFLHPNFSNSSLVNDVAVLELVRKISIRSRDNIALVCLPKGHLNQANLTSPGRCVVTGWGRPNELSDHSVRMKEIIVPIWAPDQCENKLRRSFGPFYTLPETTLCAGDEGRDACDGDGGGPLVCYEDGKWVQQGIVSFGVGCGRRELPGVYTRVSSFVPWIKMVTQTGF